MKGTTIRIFLADGQPTGILLAEISNWSGKVLVAPHSQLDQLSKREEVRRTGVYLPRRPPRSCRLIDWERHLSHPIVILRSRRVRVRLWNVAIPRD